MQSEFVAKRSDANPDEGKSKYGDVKFADEKNKKYPIDTEAHIRAAWNYINKSKNAGKYSSEDVKAIKAKIVSAWKDKIDKAGPPSTSDMQSGFIFVELNQSNLKAFDGLAAGEFTDMRGRGVTFLPEELPEYIDNTKKIIESTRTESGAVVGLPIDLEGHDHKGGAGWIVDMELDPKRSVIRFLANWTKAGEELIRENMRRFFSPATDPYNKVILGGSMTNNPGSRDDNYRYVLRPIELSAQISKLEMSDSMGSLLKSVCGEFNNEFGYDWSIPSQTLTGEEEDEYFHVFGYPENPEIFDGYLIAQSMDGDDLFKVPYTVSSDDEIEFDDRDAWVPVKINYQEMPKMAEQESKLVHQLRHLLSEFTGHKPAIQSPKGESQGDNMAGTQEVPTVAELMKAPEAIAELDRLANERAAELVKANERKAKISEFAAKLTGGEKGKGNGIAVKAEKVEAVLLALPAESQADMMALLEVTLTKTVDLIEHGHGAEFENKTELPAQIKPALAEWVKAKRTVKSFFEVNPEAGKYEQYDLAEFEQPKEK